MGLAIISACGPPPGDEDALSGVPHALFAAELAPLPQHSAIAVVAHPDDDLLFMSQLIVNALARGTPLRVIYLTAGDAGRPPSYWKQREEGIRAAYSSLMTTLPEWTQTPLPLPSGELSAWSPAHAETSLSLVFVRLPDGNTNGQGYKRSKKQSLARLWRGQRASIETLDTGRSYSKQSLQQLLGDLYSDWQELTGKPAMYSTLNCCRLLGGGRDHSDHRFAALFAVAAQAEMPGTSKLLLHWGYDITRYPENLSDAQRQCKWSTFLAYAPFDRSVWSKKHRGEPLSLYAQASNKEYAWRIDQHELAIHMNFCQAANARVTR